MKVSSWPAVPTPHDNVAGIAVEINFLWFTLVVPRSALAVHHAYPRKTKETRL
jgi:hypothetical protein